MSGALFLSLMELNPNFHTSGIAAIKMSYGCQDVFCGIANFARTNLCGPLDRPRPALSAYDCGTEAKVCRLI